MNKEPIVSIHTTENLLNIINENAKKIEKDIKENRFIQETIMKSTVDFLAKICTQIVENANSIGVKRLKEINTILSSDDFLLLRKISASYAESRKNQIYEKVDQRLIEINALATENIDKNNKSDNENEDTIIEHDIYNNDYENIFRGIDDRINSLRLDNKVFLEQEIIKWKENLDKKNQESLDEFNAYFSDAKEKAADSIGKIISDCNIKRENIYKLDRHFSDENDKALQKIENQRKEIKKVYDNILKLYHTSAGKAFTGEYTTTAQIEVEASRFWRFVSVLALGFAIWWIYTIYSEYNTLSMSRNNEFIVNWVKVGFQASLTFIAIYVSIYASQLSTRHWNEHVKNRTLALQMVALEPFMQPLEPADKSEMRKTVGERFFTGAEQCSNNMEEKQLIQACTEAIPKVVESIKELVKK